MRLGSLTVSMTLSAVLLSGCSFIGGPASSFKNPFAKQKAANHAQYGAHHQAGAQHCQIFSPTQPIPRGCRPEEVTLGVAPYGQNQYGQGQYGHTPYGAQGAHGGFPQEPQFNQPQYTSGAYGSAVGHASSAPHYKTGPSKRKPKLRGSLSLGAERSVGGSLLDYGKRLGDDIDALGSYDPQVFNEGFFGRGENGGNERTVYTANEQFPEPYIPLDASGNPFIDGDGNVVVLEGIFRPSTYESDSRPTISFDDAWAAPVGIKAGLEYILNDNTTVFANGGYTQAEGNAGTTATVTGTLYKYVEETDGAGNLISGGIAYTPNVEIANFSYDFSELRRYDLEVGARRYLKPIVKSEGYKTVTPFVGASVGASHVNPVDITFGQQQASYGPSFENITTGNNEGQTQWFEVPSDNPGASPLLGTTVRLYDSQWLPQGQLNVGAEWQVTPGFAVAAETGVRLQSARTYADFTNSDGERIQGRKGDVNVSVPVTLRGSINF